MGAAVRREGWERRLLAIVDEARGRPFELGVHDCFRLACRVVQELTGIDRWPEFAGYKTKREELALLARHGSSFEAAMTWFFGAPAVDVRWARRGDVVCAVTADEEKALGVCLGAQAAFLAPEGLVYVPVLTCVCAWKVG